MSKMVQVKWPKVISSNNITPLVGWIDLANGTMFRIAAFFVPGFYDYPRSGFWVSLERAGSFFFAIPEKPLSAAYVAEKLFLHPDGSDAPAMADWINAQFGFEDAKQQGEYRKGYILEVEPYGLIGENKIMPLVPEILE